MKKILLAITLVCLTGCSNIMGIVGMQPFDSTEYGYVVSIRTKANTGDCSKENLSSMYMDSQLLKNYTQYIPYNDKTISMATDLNKLTEELYKRDTPSSVYCKLKLNSISKSAEEIQQVVGSKPR
jgi:uncharacterized protein YceK